MLRSSLATVNGHRTALEHLIALTGEGVQEVHRVSAIAFVTFLRKRQVSTRVYLELLFREVGIWDDLWIVPRSFPRKRTTMPVPLSMDLRTRIGAACDAGDPPAEVAEVIVIGRSTEGIRLRPEVETPTHLFFFVVTPTERPHAQSFFVEGMTTIARSEVIRGRLLSAETPVQVFEIIAAADPALTG